MKKRKINDNFFKVGGQPNSSKENKKKMGDMD